VVLATREYISHGSIIIFIVNPSQDVLIVSHVVIVVLIILSIIVVLFSVSSLVQ
jgi:hypothetical protein